MVADMASLARSICLPFHEINICHSRIRTDYYIKQHRTAISIRFDSPKSCVPNSPHHHYIIKLIDHNKFAYI